MMKIQIFDFSSGIASTLLSGINISILTGAKAVSVLVGLNSILGSNAFSGLLVVGSNGNGKSSKSKQELHFEFGYVFQFLYFDSVNRFYTPFFTGFLNRANSFNIYTFNVKIEYQ